MHVFSIAKIENSIFSQVHPKNIANGRCNAAPLVAILHDMLPSDRCNRPRQKQTFHHGGTLACRLEDAAVLL